MLHEYPPTPSHTHSPLQTEYCWIPPDELSKWVHLCFVTKYYLIKRADNL